MKVIILASGSGGNCLYIEESGKGIIIDAGISRKRIIEELRYFNIELDRIQAILITHEHGDHINGLKILSKYENFPIYSSEGTLNRLHWYIPKGDFHYLLPETRIASFTIRPIPVPHDAAEPVGFVVENGDTRLMVATDLGYVNDEVLKEISQSNAIIFESNHDVDMLVNGSYPEDLKERILSRWGHLSNAQCSSALKIAGWKGLKLVVLAHLSEENNRPEIALRENGKVLFKGTKLTYAERRNITGPFNI
jgi:phosphoribosyl 1,2-cyclic phosphodiesterase